MTGVTPVGFVTFHAILRLTGQMKVEERPVTVMGATQTKQETSLIAAILIWTLRIVAAEVSLEYCSGSPCLDGTACLRLRLPIVSHRQVAA